MSAGIEGAEKALGTPNNEMVGKIKKLLVEAEKHPSPSFYQITADIRLCQRRTDEAIASAERAIALNPSDQYGYEEMSLALVLSGRAADASHYLDAAKRVDPQPRGYRHQLAGLIAFSRGQFDQAVASLEKVSRRETCEDCFEITGGSTQKRAWREGVPSGDLPPPTCLSCRCTIR